VDPAIVEEYRQFLYEQNEKILVEVKADFWKVKSYSWALVTRLTDVSGLARERTIILLNASIPAGKSTNTREVLSNGRAAARPSSRRIDGSYGEDGEPGN
jgi:hypothetical protein